MKPVTRPAYAVTTTETLFGDEHVLDPSKSSEGKDLEDAQ